jgi:hypothetical protein
VSSKLYILNVKFGVQQARLFFDGPAEGAEAFARARRDIDEIGDSSRSFVEFVSRITERFPQAGFGRIAH